MPRYYLQLPGLTFARAWSFGPIRCLPSKILAGELLPALQRQPANDSVRVAQEVVGERLADWGEDSALEVTADSDDMADRLASQAMSVIRFVMRDHVRVNVETHKIGLVGDVPAAVRHYIVLWEHDSEPVAAAGWHRIGGTVPFTFTEEVLDAWDNDVAIAFLGAQLGRSDAARSSGGTRAFTALAMLDTGFRSLSPAMRILTAAIAVEVMYSRADVDGPQSTAIARRIAYLTCQGGCGRSAPHCPYTEAKKGHKRLLEDLQRLAAAGSGWACSAFLDIVAPAAVSGLSVPPLFDARNAIAHEGGIDLDDRSRSHLIWVADNAIAAALRWYAANTSATMGDLDQEIGGAVPTSDRPG